MDNLLDNNNDNFQLDPNKDYFAELVGEGKKFKTQADLARAKMESDNYIKTLERQKDEMRNDLLAFKEDSTARAKLSDLIDQFKNVQTNNNTLQVAPTPNANEVVNQPTMKPEDFESLVSDVMSKREAENKAKNNWNEVQGKLQERYGDSFRSVLNSQMNSLGLTPDDVNTLARRSPAAFFRTFGLDQQPENDLVSPPRNSIRNNFAPNGGPKRTWTYYQDIKKKDSKLYFDPKTQAQMHKDYETLGHAFEDGDFHKFS